MIHRKWHVFAVCSVLCALALFSRNLTYSYSRVFSRVFYPKGALDSVGDKQTSHKPDGPFTKQSNSTVFNTFHGGSSAPVTGSYLVRHGNQSLLGLHVSDSDQLTILSWPYAYSLPCSKTGNKIVAGCSHTGGKSCVHVCDPELYNVSDVVIFNLCSHRHYPSYRPAQQKWVYVELEAPPQSQECWPRPPMLDNIKGVFNITSAFTADSKVPFYVFKTCELNYSTLKQFREKFKNVDFLSGRTRSVLWFVSHCPTQSRREDYAAELQKYIDIDVYGKCGNMTCGSKGNSSPSCATEMLNKTYRFYLSFENSLCENYVTEKVGRILDHSVNIIPIVLGLANYSNLYPAGTYINVRDYDSPKELAEYLHQLSRNSTMYNEYIYRKNSMDCHGGEESYLCRLCKYAHSHRGQVELIPDIRKFWSVESRCISLDQHLPNVLKSHQG